MNILISGCSFGVPNHPGGPFKFSEQLHTEFLLKDLGHNVYNCSLNGGSNLQSIEQAFDFLNGKTLPYKNFGNLSTPPTNIDLIIWFHTQIHREYRFLFPLKDDVMLRDPMVLENYKVKNNNFYGILEEVAALTYSEFGKLQKMTNSKIAVIGGAGPVHDCITEHIQPDFLIKNWISEILSYDVDAIYETSILKRIDHVMSIDLKTKLVDASILTLDLMKKSKEFYDGGHPGEGPHKKLVEQLVDKFNL
jgi:hypothetical protein